VPNSDPQDIVGDRVLSRRLLIQRAAAAGVVAVWTPPTVHSIPHVLAQGSPPPSPPPPEGCIILSPASDDKNLQEGQNYCPIVSEPCCGSAFGNAGQIDRFTFTNPAPNCSQIVVRTIALDCNAAGTSPERNPDVGQFAVIIESTTGAGCGTCTVLDAVLVSASGRTIVQSQNNGPVSCPSGDGVDASFSCADPDLNSSTRLAVRLTCATECL
jgi:hypothetical protein